jgi:hypothetical protein
MLVKPKEYLDSQTFSSPAGIENPVSKSDNTGLFWVILACLVLP